MTAPSPSPTPAAPSAFNPWPYGVAGFLVLFATTVVLFARFALGHPVDLVRPDYYEQEIRHQQQMDRVERTRALGDRAGVRLDASRGAVVITVPASHAGPEPVGTVQFYRPSDPARDRIVPLPGLWKVQLRWSAGDQEYSIDVPVVVPGRDS